MKILKSAVIQAATIQMEDWEERYPEDRYAVLWKAKRRREPIFGKIITRCRGILRIPVPFSRAEKNLEKMVSLTDLAAPANGMNSSRVRDFKLRHDHRHVSSLGTSVSPLDDKEQASNRSWFYSVAPPLFGPAPLRRVLR